MALILFKEIPLQQLPTLLILKAMRSFWSDPYLWVHLAGIAAVPLFLELCLLGLAVGTPIAPVGLEWLLVGAIGVAPVLWMQWQRPFSIFSLIVLALQPQQLTDDQRRILRLFRTPLEKGLAALMAIALLATLWQLFQIAPIASEVTPFSRFGHLGGCWWQRSRFWAAFVFAGSHQRVADFVDERSGICRYRAIFQRHRLPKTSRCWGCASDRFYRLSSLLLLRSQRCRRFRLRLQPSLRRLLLQKLPKMTLKMSQWMS